MYVCMHSAGDQWTLLDERTVLTLRRNARVSCDSPYRECAATVDPCLFNIVEDPCERNNLARHRTDVLAEMEELLGRWVVSAAGVSHAHVCTHCLSAVAIAMGTVTYTHYSYVWVGPTFFCIPHLFK